MLFIKKNVSTLVPSPHLNLSLAHVLGETDLKVNRLISMFICLISRDPSYDKISGLEDLIIRLKGVKKETYPHESYIERLVGNLTCQQFAFPAAEALRELITNSLDAQHRANTTTLPITMTYNEDTGTLTVTDNGDGVTARNLIRYLVPTMSINSQEKRTPGSAGKFGQGALSTLHFLVPEKTLPKFLEIKNQGIEFVIPIIINEQPKKVLIKSLASSNDQFRTYLFDDTEKKPHEKRSKIDVITRSGTEQQKIEFLYRQKGICIDIMERSKDTPQGTTTKIRSPKLTPEVLTKVTDYFRFVPNTPIIINDQHMNDLSIYSSFRFPGGVCYYLFSEDPGNQKGEIYFCERGRKIAKFEVTNAPCCLVFAISFDSLPLAHDRSTLNYHHKETIDGILAVIDMICNLPGLSKHDRGVLLNSLHPILIPNRFNMLQLVHQFTEGYLPYDRKLCASLGRETFGFLHPDFIRDITGFEKLEATGSYDFHLVSRPKRKIVFIKHCEQYHVFIDESLINLRDQNQVRFNLYVIREWLLVTVQEEKKLHFDPKQCFEVRFQAGPSEDSRRETPKELKPLGVNEELSEDNVIEKTLDTYLTSSEHIKCLCTESLGEMLSDMVNKKLISQICYGYTQLVNALQLPDEASYTYIENITGFLHGLILKITQHKKDPFTCPSEIDQWVPIYLEHISLLIAYFEKLQDSERINDFFSNVVVEENSRRIISNSNGIASFRKILEEAYQVYLRYEEIIRIVTPPQDDDHSNLLLDLSMSENPIERANAWKTLMRTCPPQLRLNVYDTFRFYGNVTALTTYPDAYVKAFFWAISNCSIHQLPTMTDLFHRNIDTLIMCRHEYPLEIKKTLIRLYLLLTWQQEQLFDGNIEQKDKSIADLLNRLPGVLLQNKEWENIVTEIYEFNYIAGKMKLFMKLYGFVSTSQEYSKHKQDLMDFMIDTMSRLHQTGYQQVSEDEEYSQWAIDNFLSKKKIPKSDYEGHLIDRHLAYEFFEELQLLNSRTRFLLGVTCFGNQAVFITTDYPFPVLDCERVPLHTDTDVCQEIGSSDVALTKIKNSTRQNSDRYGFPIRELLRNSADAESTEVLIEMHMDASNNIVVTFQDNGKGIDKKGLKALKTPSKSTKDGYGIGFFSVFSNYDAAAVLTSPSESEQRTIIFEKDTQDLTIQSDSKSGEYDRGTTTILKKECHGTNPLIEAGLIIAEIHSIVSQYEGMNVYVNGRLVSGESIDPLSSRTEDFYNNDQHEQVTVETVCGDGGLYREGLRIDSVPSEAYGLIPSPLKEILEDEKIHFNIFIPPVDQSMNRALLMNNNQMDKAIQRGAFVAAIGAIHKLWLRGKLLRLLSDDYWHDFRVLHDLPKPLTQRLSASTVHKTWNPCIDDRTMQTIVHIKSVLEKLNKGNNNSLRFPFLPEETQDSIDDAIYYLYHLTINQHHTATQMSLATKYHSSSDLVELLTNTPLINDTISFMDIRRAFQKELHEHGVLRENDYDLETSMQALDSAVEKIKKQFDPEIYGVIIETFKKKIKKRIDVIKHQAKTLKDTELEKYKPLVCFLQDSANRLWHRNIEVRLYSAPDGWTAHTKPGTNILWVNIAGSADKFLQFVKDLKDDSFDEALKKHMDTIVTWLQNLCHEMTHMDEPQDCLCTHDKRFFSEMAEKITTAFTCNPEQLIQCMM